MPMGEQPDWAPKVAVIEAIYLWAAMKPGTPLLEEPRSSSQSLCALVDYFSCDRTVLGQVQSIHDVRIGQYQRA
jgi:hypothetical protein